MSLIRCLSNPEGLYIWDSTEQDGKTHIANITWSYHDGKHPRHMEIPWQDFRSILLAWDKNPPDLGGKRSCRGAEAKLVEYGKVELSDGKGKSVIMWQVTWQYIVNNLKQDYKQY